MKTLIYITGTLGGIIIVAGILGIYIEFTNSGLFLLSGIIILGLISLPLTLIYHNQKMISKIIHTSSGKKRNSKPINKVETETKGWGMNDSPFRERKSGLTWGGGNIHGAKASRGSRRSFLRK